MKRQRMMTWTGLAVWGLGVLGSLALAWSQSWSLVMLVSVMVGWSVFSASGVWLSRRFYRRRLRTIRQNRSVHVEGERLAYEEEGRIMWVFRKDISRIREWPKRGIIIDTHAQKGAITIPEDSENYHELRVALMLWDPNLLETVGLRTAK